MMMTHRDAPFHGSIRGGQGNPWPFFVFGPARKFTTESNAIDPLLLRPFPD